MSILRHMRSLAMLAAMALSMVAGCAKEEARTHDPMPVEATPPAAAEASSTIKVRSVDKAAFEAVLAGHRGKVVLVDMWATWCGPCVKGFPHTVEMAKKYAPEGLAVVSLSFDDADSTAEVEAFLQQQNAQLDNLISQYGISDQSYEDFGVETGALPHYQLYDREGKLVRELTSGDPTARSVTHEDVDAAVRELLARPAAAPES